MRSIWFMDVDGVMAPFSRGGAFRDWVRSPHERYQLWLSPTQAASIREVLTATGTDLIWVTTWAEHAAEYVERFLGWPTHRFAPLPLPGLKGGDPGPTGRWWKLDAVEHFLHEQRPERMVWSDDDLDRHRSSVVGSLATYRARPLLQSPNPHIGLTERAIREAREHLNG
jgi:hypothetical protein